MLTNRQVECLAIIDAHTELHGRGPALKELGRAMGLTERGARDHVDRLVKLGHLHRTDGLEHGIEIAGERNGDEGT